MRVINKNSLLLSTYVLSLLTKLFFDTEKRINLSIFVERSTRLDFVALYYSIAINFIIMAYCLHYPKGIDKRVSRFILIITVLDLLHLLLLAKQGFGVAKIFISFLLILAYEFYKKHANN